MKIKLSNILYVLIGLYGALALTPYGYSYCKEIILIIGMVWMFLVICYMWKRHADYTFILVVTVFFGWNIVLKILGYSTAKWSYYGMGFLFVTVVCMFAFLTYDEDKRRTARLAKFLYFVLFLNMLDNIFLYNKYENLDENRTSDFYLEAYGKINAGTTVFAFLIAIAGIVALIYVLWDRRGNIKLAMLLVYMLSMYSIVFCMGRGVASAMFVLGTVLVLGNKICRKIDLKSRKLLIVCICVILVLVVTARIQILDILISVVENYVSVRLANRLINIKNLFTGENQWLQSAGNSLSIRLYFMIEDIKFFLGDVRTVIVGNGFHRFSNTASVYDALVLNKAGGHSDLFDMLTQYGSVGLCYMIVFFKEIYKKGKKGIGNIFFWTCIVMLYIFQCVMGTGFAVDVGVAVLLMAPGMLYAIKGASDENQQYA